MLRRAFVRLAFLLPLLALAPVLARATTRIIYVGADAAGGGDGASWATAYNDLQTALGAAAPTSADPVEIWLKTGVYKPTTGTDRTVRFNLKSYLTLRGGFAGTETAPGQRPASATATAFTVLSGDIGTAQPDAITSTTNVNDLAARAYDFSTAGAKDNSYNVVRAYGVVAAVLDRLVVAGGCANSTAVSQGLIETMLFPTLSDGGGFRQGIDNRVTGGGVFAGNARVGISDCWIVGNFAQGPGGGIVVRGGAIELKDTRLVRNVSAYAGGGLSAQQTEIIALDRNRFYGNSAVFLGGGLFLQADTDNKYVKAYESSALAALAGLTVEEPVTLPALSTPLLQRIPDMLYDKLKEQKTQLTIAKTLATKAAEKAGLLAPSKLLTPFAAYATKGFGAALSSSYSWISYAVTAVDIGVQIALFLGADPNDPFIKGWSTFSAGFAAYATPSGLAVTIKNLLFDWLGSTPSFQERATKLREQDYADNQNALPVTGLLDNRFERNFSGGYGGGATILRQNVLFHRSWFVENEATFGGGALAGFAYNDVDIENSAVLRNRSAYGHSAFAFGFRSVARLVNLTITGGFSGVASGYAVGADAGADVSLLSSVLWNNGNASLGTGADLYATRKADLDEAGLKAYNDAGDSHGLFTGILDFQYCDVQGLNSLTYGTALFWYAPDADTDATGMIVADHRPNVGEGIRPGIGSRGNFARDPYLLQDIYPHPTSPLINAGGPKTWYWNGTNDDINGRLRDFYFNPASPLDIGAVESNGTLPGGTIIYVDGSIPSSGDGLSWAGAKKTLAEAFAQPLSPGGQIWIAQGTYPVTTGVDRNASLYLRPGVSVIGGLYNGATSADVSNPSLYPTIITGNIANPASTADNTYCLLNGRDHPDGSGLPRILRGLTFTSATSNSAAVWIVAPAVVQHCTFLQNTGGRALQIDARSGFHAEDIAQVLDCTFDRNTAGGLGCRAFNLDVLRSNFYDNSAPSGGGLAFSYDDSHTSLKLERCLFYHNAATAGRGGGAVFQGHTLVIAHCVFADNTATPAANDASDRGGAGFYWVISSLNPAGSWTTLNSIFYGNRLAGTFAPTALEDQQFSFSLALQQSSPLWRARQFSGNDVEGLNRIANRNGAGGNVDYDPFFVAPTSHNFSLAADSLLINHGVAYTSGTDLAAVYGGVRDIGVVETTATSSQTTFPIESLAFPANASGRTYQIAVGSPYATGASSFVWEVRRPDATDWATVVNDTWTSGAGTAALTLTNPPHTWNGSIYRLRIVLNGLRLFSRDLTIAIQPSFLYVKPSATGTGDGTTWANASTLAAAVRLAVPFTQIWVAQGNYSFTTSSPPAMVLAAGARLRGGFAGTETSLAQRPAVGTAVTHLVSTTGYNLILVAGTATAADSSPVQTIVDRITCDRGAVSLIGSYAYVFLLQGADTAFTDMTFDGTAADVRVESGQVSFDRCSFTRAYNAVSLNSTTARFNTSTFANNGNVLSDTWAPAILSLNSTLAVADSSFTGNAGRYSAAIYSQGTSGALDLQRCRFLDNTGYRYGGAVVVSNPAGGRIANSLFARNTTRLADGYGAGLAVLRGSVAVAHCTFAGNIAANAPAIYADGSVQLVNSIVWANTFTADSLTPASYRAATRGNLATTNSLVQGASAYDPLFDPASADYALTAWSPALDLGGTDAAVSGSLDLAGNPRRYASGAADLGASEFTGAAGTPVYLSSPVTDQTAYVERTATFTLTGNIGSTVGSTNFTWQYFNGSAWVAVSGLANATVATSSTTSTLTLTSVTLAQNGLQVRVTAPGVGSLGTATLTVKSRVVLYVDSRVASSGDGLTWANAFKTITAALAAATADTDLWVAGGDYADAGIALPAGTRLFLGFAGTETDVAQRDPVANPIRIGQPLADVTLVIADVTTLVPPLTLAAGQSARWQVDTGDGNWTDLVADADRVITVVNGIPGLSLHANPELTGYRYRAVVSDATGDLFASDSAQLTVIARPTVYVDAAATGGAHTGADWANAFSDLSAALAVYPAFADFKIAEGTYIAPANAPFALRRSLTLTGGYVAGTATRDPAAHRTILQSAGGTVASAIALKSNPDRGTVDSLTVVDGFVFRSAGTGLSLSGASPAIRNCRFESLITGIVATASQFTVEDSTFTGQTLSGIRTSNQSGLTVLRCTFTGNSAGTDVYVGGGAIGLGDGSSQSGPQSLVVTDSTFTGNSAASGGAISVRSFGSSVAITRCRFDGNTASDTGGAITAVYQGSVVIRDSLLVRNQSARFGSAIASSSPLTLTFVTVAANVAGAHPSNTAISASSLTVRDSILWGNTNAGTNYGEYGQYGTDATTPTFADTIVDGLSRTTGARLLPFNPRFVDAANGNFRLAADSPALGLAQAADLLASETDLAGTARPAGAASDLGAYESAAAPAPTYTFANLPASLSGYAGSNLPTLAQIVPAGFSGVWQYFNGSTWITLPDSSSRALPGATSVFVNTQSSAYYTQLSIFGITAALDGTALRFALTSGGTTYPSPAIPISVLAFETIYVDASRASSGDGRSWSTAFQTLPEALAVVDSARRVIHVAAGTYRGPFTLPMRFEMLGGFPAGGSDLASRDPSAHPTILTGLAANAADRADVVVRFTYTGTGYSQPVLDGFVVENGHTGLLAEAGVSPALRRLVVRGHDATGLVLTQSGGASLTDSVFENNTGTDGGALRSVAGSATTIERVVFRANSATRGGALYLNDSARVRSVLLSGNVADTGGALYVAGTGLQLTQVTLAGNRAALAPAIYTRNAPLTLRNSIVWGNRATSGEATVQFGAEFSGTAFVFDHVLAEQAPTTSGVIRQDPLFVSAVDAASAPTTTGDYRLRGVSPAIDAGADAFAADIALDVAGTTRLVGTVDLGAYESATTGVTPLAIAAQPAALIFKRSGVGNTFTVSATGAASILWQYAAPSGAWTSLVGVPGFSGATTASLTVTSATSALNGYRFRAQLTGTDGTVITTAAQTLTVYASRLYVNAARSGTDTGDGLAWSTAFRTLDAALAAAPLDPEGTEFWLAAGTYTPATVYAIRSGLAFYGGFAGTESAIAERDPAANVTAFTAAGQSSIFSATAATGITLPARFDGLTFRDSAAATAVTSVGCATIFDRVSFTGLRAALSSRDATVTLRRIDARGNASSATFFYALGGSVLIENSLLAGNVASGSGQLAYFAAPTVLRHVTVAGNRGDRAPITFADANNQTYNSIFWGNRLASSPTVATSLASSARFYVVWHSVVENLSDLTRSTTSLVAATAADPRFVAPLAASAAPFTGGDFSLANNSTAIDTGKNDQTSSDALDLALQSRQHGVYVDPGAYEYPADDLYALTTPPASTYASALTPATFTVAASRPATFAWEVSSDNGQNYTTVPGASTATLSIPGSAGVDGHLYRARVQFTTGPELVSDAATLTFLNPVVTATAPAGYATPATFAATANQSVTAWQWQVSVSGAAFADVPGANSATLSVLGDASFANRTYRVQATFAAGPTVPSNAVAFTYADAVPASASPTALGFSLAGGVQTASLTDASFAVLPQFSGRLSLAADLTPSFNGPAVSFAFAEPLAAGSRVFVTTTSALLRADGVGARPRVWEYRVPTVSGAGAFASPTTLSSTAATALTAGDLDADGTIDLLVADTDGLRVWRNDGLGAFTADASAFGSASATALALGSLTANATLDAVVVTATGDVQIWTNDATGHFTLAQTLAGLSARAVALGDLDADGDLDLVIATATDHRVYLNNGSAAFVAGATFGSAASTSVALGDLDLDGDLDAVVTSATGTIVYSNNGSAAFSAAFTSATPADRVALADLDADGRLDVILTRADQPARLWRNLAAFQFAPLTAAPGGGTLPTLAAGDVDGDGRADLILTDAVGTTAPWLTSAALASTPAVGQPLLNLGAEVTLADVDGDSALDLVGLDASGHPVVSLYHLTPTALDEGATASLAAAGFTPTPTNVHLVSLPAHGTLLDGATPVQIGDTFTLAAAAALTYAPAADFNGLDSFTWSSTAGGTAHTYWLLVRLVPGAVTATADAFTVAQGATATALTGGVTSVLANDTNLDPGAFTALLVTRPAHGTVTLNSDGTFSYVHDGTETRTDGFTYRAKNLFTGSSADAAVAITITNVNAAPTALALTAAAGTHYTGQPAGDTVATLAATDPDPEDAGLLTFTLVSGTGSDGNADFTVSGSALVTAGPIDASLGLTRSVRVRATDPAGLFTEQPFTLSFTPAPTPAASSATTAEDTAKSLTLSATGGAAALTYEIVTAPTHGTLALGSQLSALSSSATYVPALDYAGSDSFTFRVSDGTVTSDPATVSLTITPVNDAPTLASHAIATDEDTPVTFTLAGSDVENDALAYHLSTNPRLGGLVIDGASATYTPHHLGGRLGTEDSFLLYVDDGALPSAPVLFTAHITAVPHAPVLASLAPGGYGGFKNQPIAFTVSATDLDGDTLTYRVGTAPAHGTVSVNGTSITYVPTYNYSGADTFTLVASDGALDSAPVTATVAVSDPAPTAYDLSFTGAQHTTLHGYLQGSDPLHDPLTYQILTSPAHGALEERTEVVTAGSTSTLVTWIDYTPAASFSGDDTLTYVAIDDAGQASDPATITFHVTANNLAPVAADVSVSQLGLTSTAAVTLAATDAEGETLTYRIVTPPTHGSLAGDGSAAVSYTHDPTPFVGTDTFTYVAHDGTQDSAPATVTLTFTKDVRAAHTVGDVATIYRGLGADIEVLANDSDDWGDPLFITTVTQPAHGTVTKFSGFVHYQHNGDAATDDEFTYTVSNFSGLTVTEHVFVSIADHSLNVTSSADSGEGTLRAAIDTVNRYAFTPLTPSGDRATWTITILLSGDAAVIEPVALGTSNADAPAAAAHDALGDSAYEIQGNALIRGLADNNRTTLRITGGQHRRHFYIDPRAHVTLRNLILTGGDSPFGGSILNDGDLTLENVTLSANTASTDGTTPGRGGALYQRGLSTFNTSAALALTNTTFSANLADEGAGLYQAGGTVVAHSATFTGHDATACDYRLVAGTFTAESLTADTPGAPWFGPLSATTIRSRFAQTIPVNLPTGQSLAVTSRIPWSGDQNILIAGPTYTVSGRGDTRTVSVDLGSSPTAGVQYLTATATGSGVAFIRTAEVTVDPALLRTPVAVEDYVTVPGGNTTIQVHDLLLANDSDPDGQSLFIVNYTQPSYGTVSEIGGVLSYTSPWLSDGSAETFTYTISNGAHSATATVHVLIRANRNLGVTSAADSDSGSLRAALAQATQYSAQPWTLKPAGLASPALTFATAAENDANLGASAFVITTDVTIDGADLADIVLSPDASAAPMRLFRIAPGGKLTLRHLTVSGGSAHLGGAIYNEGTLILDHATISDSTATALGPTAGGRGGAIYNRGGTVTLADSTLEANSATDASDTSSASVYGLGGAIYTRDGSVSLTGSALSDNAAHHGGGVYAEGVSGATVSFTTSVLDNPDAIADLAATGAVAFHRTNSTIARIDGPSVSSLTDQSIAKNDFTGDTTGSVAFTASDDVNGLAFSAWSSVDGVIPNASFAFDTTDGVHHLNFTAALSGLSDLSLTASAGGVSFTEHFRVVANTGSAANPTVYPQSGGTIYVFQSRILDPITGKVYKPDGTQLSGGNGPASDPLGLPLTVVAVTQPAHGTATINADGRIVYTHTDASFTSGSDEFFYTVSNGFGGTATTGAQVTIQPAEFTVTSLSALNSALATANAQPATPWAIHIVTNSNTTWTTSGYYSGSGSDGFYSALKIAGHVTIDATASPGFTLTVPTPGYAGPPARHFLVLAGAELNLKDLRLAGGAAYAYGGTPPAGGSIYNFGTFTADHVTFASNSSYASGALGGALYNAGGSATLVDCSFTGNGGNTVSKGGAIASRNGTLTLTNVTFSGNHASVGKDVYLLGDGATATLTHPGTPTADAVFATLNGGAIDALPFLHAPVARDDSFGLRTDHSAVVPIDILLANDSDADGDAITFVSADAETSYGTGTITIVDGNIVYTPYDPDNAGDDAFDYTITDSSGNTATASVYIGADVDNQPPTLDPIAPLTLLEDPIAPTVNLTGISAGFGETQNLTITATSSNPALIPDPVVAYTNGDSTGTLTLAPAANASGTATLTVTVQDDGEILSEGLNTLSRTFKVTITSVNDAPTLDAIANPAAILENASDQTIALTGLSAGGGETGQTLTVAATSSDPTLIPDPTVTYTSAGATGSLTYAPVSGRSGTATITVTVHDDAGTADGGADTFTRIFDVAVTPVNDPPTLDALADPAAILEDAAQQTVNLTGISAGYLETQPLTLTATSSNPALIPNPTVTYTDGEATGTLTYTPVANASGTATITVTLHDDAGTANGGVDTTTRTFTVTVTAVNDAPTLAAISDPSAILEDASQQTIALSGLSAGPGESAQSLTLTATSSNPALIPDPSIAYTAGASTASLTYTPVANASGTATITVTVQDDAGTANNATDTTTRTFTVTVTAVNDAPTLAAISDPSAILEDATQQTIALSGLSAGPGESAQSLTLTATSSNPALIPNPSIAYTADASTASLAYTPVANASGTATITVTVQDDGGTANNATDTVTRTFTVTVTPVNDAPTLDTISDPAAILEDASQQTVGLSGISAGPGESAQSLTITATSSHTAIIPNPTVAYTAGASTASLAYTPVANASGSATITVTIRDDGGTADGGADTVTRTFHVTVTAQPEAPPVVTISPRSGGGVTLHLVGAAGTVYTVSVSTDLATWTTLNTVTTNAGGTADVDDLATPAAGAARFYRADAD